MGKAIVYCGDCGKSLSEDDFVKGRARTLEEGPYCTQCRPLPAESSSKLVVPKKISTTRIPVAPQTTRRAPTPPPVPASRKGLLLGGIAAGSIALIVATVFLSRGKEEPPPPPKPPPVRPVPREAGDDPVERAMRAEREKEEAAKFDRFLAQIREMLKDTRLPERRAEVEGMIASAEKIAGARKADIQALRAELARAMEEGARERERAAQLEELLPRIREAIRDVRKLKTRRAEVENWLDQAEKLAGPRRAEVDALRAEAVEAFNKAERYRDLAGHWKLDGDARDSTASGFHGTIKGSPKFVPGKIGSALRFDGDDQELLLPGTPELDRVHEDSYTFAAWFRPEGVPPVSEEDAAHFRYAILVRQGWHLGLSYDHSGHFFMDHWLTGDQNVGLANSKTFPPGDWHHVAGIVDRDAGTTLIHVDGQAAGRRSWTAGKTSRNYGKAALRIGCGSPGASRYAWPARGTIDDVRIYGRALSAAEVRKLFEAGKQGRDQ